MMRKKEEKIMLLTLNTDMFTDDMKNEVEKQYKVNDILLVQMKGIYKNDFVSWLKDKFKNVEPDEENKGFYKLIK